MEIDTNQLPFLENIKETLSKRQVSHTGHSGLKESAVVLPLFVKDGELYILFTKRTNHVENHKGQMSFPGGRFQDGDASLRDTALREAEEEIGLKKEDIILIGELDDVETHVSNFNIAPYVISLPYPYEFNINNYEVDQIIELPLRAFLDCNNFHVNNEEGIPPPPYFTVQGEIIWGATARILINFLTLVYPQNSNCLPTAHF